MSGSARVSVRLPRALAEHAHGRKDLTLAVPANARLRDVIDALRAEAPAVARRVVDETGEVRRFVNVYVGDDECRTLEGLATPVPDGTVVFIVGSVAGG
jgi:molybdopterin converting factor small subunit